MKCIRQKLGYIGIILKYMWLISVKIVHSISNKLTYIFSYFFLTFSVITCLVILIPTCFDSIPIFSYLIRKNELPMMYELQGEIKILDEKGNIVNKNVEIFVGGYSESLHSTDFILTFSAPAVNEIYVVIKYDIDGKIQECTRCLIVKNENHVIKEEFIIYA